ncbi:Trp biosynthesis-associated membrane protein [Pseudonocardia sp. HH130630-07]|uniref:Trp biosynthesis-associated membrane protein n=1 Tax=Pseudonocardia sp. HH130630-07 TaxID=1690815 RepID=UPI0018D357C7|nr:Trp biosynthesis-associated membrane protein [Pseudonocardia sp. HH130630-07]
MDVAARTDRRAFGVVVAGLLAAAAALWGSGSSAWFVVDVPTATRGTVEASATGAQLQPVVTAVAALLVAAVAALVALSGIARRLLGGVVALAGVAAAGLTLRLLAVPPTPVELASARAGLTAPNAPQGAGPVTATAWPWLAVAGGIVALAAAVVLVVRERRLPRLGARYSAPGAPGPTTEQDPDRAAWERLDEGGDPTVGPHEREN